MKPFCAIFFSLTLLLSANVMAAKLPPYLNYNWGDAVEDVIKRQGPPLETDPGGDSGLSSLLYRAPFPGTGLECDLSFDFADGKLCDATYMLTSVKNVTLEEAQKMRDDIEGALRPQIPGARYVRSERYYELENDDGSAGDVIWRYRCYIKTDDGYVLVLASHLNERIGYLRLSLTSPDDPGGEYYKAQETESQREDGPGTGLKDQFDNFWNSTGYSDGYERYQRGYLE